jgi:hypothetical protein
MSFQELSPSSDDFDLMERKIICAGLIYLVVLSKQEAAAAFGGSKSPLHLQLPMGPRGKELQATSRTWK